MTSKDGLLLALAIRFADCRSNGGIFTSVEQQIPVVLRSGYLLCAMSPLVAPTVAPWPLSELAKRKGGPESRPSLRKKPRASGGLGGAAKVQSHTKRPPSRPRGGPFVLAPSRQPVMLQKETANRPARNPPRGTKERAHRAGRKRAGTLDTEGALNVPLRQKEGGLKPPRHQDPGNIHSAHQ